MLVMKEVRAAWILAMTVMINSYMAGMELSRDNCRDHNIKCNIVGLFK